MNSVEIQQILSQKKYSPNDFIGVFAIDKIPLIKMKKPCSLIVNTDYSFNPGEHWVAIHIPKKGKILYFDSFGMRPMNKEIYDFFQLNGKNYFFNNKQLQKNNSDSCGKYCVLFILFMWKKYKYYDFIKLFANDKNYNEIFINNYFEKFI